MDFLSTSSSSLGSDEEGSLSLSLSLGSLSLSLSLGSLLSLSLRVKELLELLLEDLCVLLALVPVRLDRVLLLLDDLREEPVKLEPRLDIEGALLAFVDAPVLLELIPVLTEGGTLDLPVRLLLLLLLLRDDLELPDRD